MIVIPAIDIIDGQCVRLKQGDFDRQTTYKKDPVELAIEYERSGASHIHIVDLDAARRKGDNKDIIFEIGKQTNLRIQTGGGIDSAEKIEAYLKSGVNALIIGSAAVKHRDKVKGWINTFGEEKFIIGADIYKNKIAIDAWNKVSGEDISDFVDDYMKAGASTFLCTDIQKDGMLEGTSNDLYNDLMLRFPGMKLIASGGVSSIEDIEELKRMNMYACVVGKALFENKISLEELFTTP